MKRISTVIFDIGDVLINFRWSYYVNGLFDEHTAKVVTDAIWGNHRWDRLDLGIGPAENVLMSFIAAAPAYESQIRHAFRHIDLCMSVKTYTADWINELKKHDITVLYLSNFSYYLRDLAPDVLRFTESMDGGIYSCDVHKIKPDPAIFTLLCQTYRRSPEECIFIDDNKANIDAAAKLGFHALHFTDYARVHEEANRLLGING